MHKELRKAARAVVDWYKNHGGTEYPGLTNKVDALRAALERPDTRDAVVGAAVAWHRDNPCIYGNVISEKCDRYYTDCEDGELTQPCGRKVFCAAVRAHQSQGEGERKEESDD